MSDNKSKQFKQLDENIADYKEQMQKETNMERIKSFPKEFRQSLLTKNKLRTKRAMDILNIRVNELKKLKKVLSDNKICNCA